jgi:hypothetical protein
VALSKARGLPSFTSPLVRSPSPPRQRPIVCRVNIYTGCSSAAPAGLPVPSTSTILHHHALITPQPRKRPRSSHHRFEAAQPDQCWQADFTPWQLADGTEVEILNWLDDHWMIPVDGHRRPPCGHDPTHRVDFNRAARQLNKTLVIADDR